MVEVVVVEVVVVAKEVEVVAEAVEQEELLVALFSKRLLAGLGR